MADFIKNAMVNNPLYNPFTGAITFSSSTSVLFTRSETGYASIPSAGYGARICCISSAGSTSRDSQRISSSCRRITGIRSWMGAIRVFAVEPDTNPLPTTRLMRQSGLRSNGQRTLEV